MAKKVEFMRCEGGKSGCEDCPHARIHQRVLGCAADLPFCPGCKPVHTEVRWVPVAPDGMRGYRPFLSMQAARAACLLDTRAWATNWPAAKKLGWRVQRVYVVDAEWS